MNEEERDSVIDSWRSGREAAIEMAKIEKARAGFEVELEQAVKAGLPAQKLLEDVKKMKECDRSCYYERIREGHQAVEEYFNFDGIEPELRVTVDWDGSATGRVRLAADFMPNAFDVIQVSLSLTLTAKDASLALHRLAESLETQGDSVFAEAKKIMKSIPDFTTP